MPELFIITGSNGAGKSSIGPEYLPAHIRQQGPIFDGDKLYIEKRKELWRTIKSHKECSKLAYAFVWQTGDRYTIGNVSTMVSAISAIHYSKNPGCRAKIPLTCNASKLVCGISEVWNDGIGDIRKSRLEGLLLPKT